MRSLAILGSALALLTTTLALGENNVVSTQYGKVRGISELQDGLNLTSFYGIPFAAPPTGANRFRPPQPHERWNDVRACDVDKFFHVCPQFYVKGNEVYGQEDCLYMNIYVPETDARQGPLPVMFWIYGGGYTIGDAYEFGFYRGRHLAATRGVIVVEFNYRLGALGLLSHPALMAESGTTGNYALQDQSMALLFAYNNIANFGGDPSRITIFGESAGAFSVCWHLVSPASNGLFSAAIMESGTCQSAEFFVSLNRSYTFSEEAISYVGCDMSSPNFLNCIRSVRFEDFMSNPWPQNATIPPLAPVMPWGPAIDGSPQGLLDRPINLLKTGQFSRVPIIMGTNKDEGTALMLSMPNVVHLKLPLSPGDLSTALAHFFNQTTINQLLTQYYLLQNFKDADDLCAHILRDYFFLCSTRNAARAISSYGVPTYVYQFVYAMKNWVDYQLLGDYHSSELPFVFDNQFPGGLHEFDAEEKRMAASFTLYWTNMAKFGTPNKGLGSDQITWPVYNATADMNIFMDVPTRSGAHLNQTVCDYFDTVYPTYYFQ